MNTTALIVREGTSRIRWAGGGGTWRLTGIWPSAGEQLQLSAQLAAGRPLLVVLEPDPPSVPVWRSELADGLLPLGPGRPVHSVNHEVAVEESPAEEPEEELLDVVVPFLDWLPERLRARGRAFSEQARELISHTPAPLLAALIVEDEPVQDDQVRFVHRTGGRPPTAAELDRLAVCLLSRPVAA